VQKELTVHISVQAVKYVSLLSAHLCFCCWYM